MKNKSYTFDYHSGTIRRDLLAEGPKTIFVKNPAVKRNNKGFAGSVLSLFSRK